MSASCSLLTRELSKGGSHEARFDRWFERLGDDRRGRGGECASQYQPERLPGQYVRAVRGAGTVGMVRQCWSGSPRQAVRGRCRHQSRLRFHEGLPGPAGFGSASATRVADRSPPSKEQQQLIFLGSLLVTVPGGALDEGRGGNQREEIARRLQRLEEALEGTEYGATSRMARRLEI